MLSQKEINMMIEIIDDRYDLTLNYSSPASMLSDNNPTKYPFSHYDDVVGAKELYRKLILLSDEKSKESYYNPEVK